MRPENREFETSWKACVEHRHRLRDPGERRERGAGRRHRHSAHRRPAGNGREGGSRRKTIKLTETRAGLFSKHCSALPTRLEFVILCSGTWCPRPLPPSPRINLLWEKAVPAVPFASGLILAVCVCVCVNYSVCVCTCMCTGSRVGRVQVK